MKVFIDVIKKQYQTEQNAVIVFERMSVKIPPVCGQKLGESDNFMSVFATLWNLLSIKTSFPGGFSDYNLDMICILPFKQGVILVGKLFDLLLCKFDLRWDDKVEDKPDWSLKSHAAVRKSPDRSTSKPDLLIFFTHAKSCSHLCSIQKRQFVNNCYRAYFSNFFSNWNLSNIHNYLVIESQSTWSKIAWSNNWKKSLYGWLMVCLNGKIGKLCLCRSF